MAAPASSSRALRLADLRGDARLYRILLDNAVRGLRVQALLRFTLATFIVVVVVAVAPQREQIACDVVAGVYAGWTVAVAWLARQGGERAIRLIWPALFGDLLTLVALALLASRSEQSWTTDVLVNGFFLIPVLASTQLRPGVGAALVAPTIAAYLGSLIAARHANGEPWASIALQTVALAAVSLGGVLLSWVQRARVLQIANLIVDRGRLSTELAEVEVSARRDLAEELHDGALQYVLAAGLDLEDLRADEDPQALERIELALRESASLLRAKVSQLHPSVLETTGLVRALQDLADATAARGRLTVRLDCTDWSDIRRSPADEILYGAARELLANVVKHAAADAATIRLSDDDAELRLTVADDGRGFAEELLDRRLADGHIGLASQRIRTEAAGGSLAIRSSAEGTVAEIRLPAPPSPN